MRCLSVLLLGLLVWVSGSPCVTISRGHCSGSHCLQAGIGSGPSSGQFSPVHHLAHYGGRARRIGPSTERERTPDRAVHSSPAADRPATTLLRKVNPVTFLTVGVRRFEQAGLERLLRQPAAPPARDVPGRAGKRRRPASRVRAGESPSSSTGCRAGPFRGDLRFTVYPGCRLVHTEAVVSTDKDACRHPLRRRADRAEAGLEDGRLARHQRRTTSGARRLTAEGRSPSPCRHRTIVAEGDGGVGGRLPAAAPVPLPARLRRQLQVRLARAAAIAADDDWGFGVRQPPEGDKRFVPWVNAPPGTEQHLGVFYLLEPRPGAEAPRARSRRFTHGDRFKKLDGYRTFTSHYHIEHTLDFRQQQKRAEDRQVPKGLEEPPFVKTFKAHGVDIVHLAEFHVNHTPEFIAERLPHVEDAARRMPAAVRRATSCSCRARSRTSTSAATGSACSRGPSTGCCIRSRARRSSRQVEGLGTVYAVQTPRTCCG